MGDILARISGGAASTGRDFEDNFIKQRLIRAERDLEKQLMILANGDISQYMSMKKITVGEYLIKLELHVEHLEAIENGSR